MFKKSLCLMLAILCLISFCSLSSAEESSMTEYTFGSFQYSVWSDWSPYPAEYGQFFVSNPSNSSSASLTVVSMPIPVLSIIDMVDQFFPSSDYEDNLYQETLYSSLLWGIASGMDSHLEESSSFENDNLTGKTFKLFITDENAYLIGFAIIHNSQCLVMFYSDDQKDPDTLIAELKEEIIPHVRFADE